MGVSGTMEYLSELLSSSKKKKKKQLNTVAVKIRMDCEGCALKVKKALSGVKGNIKQTSVSAFLSTASLPPTHVIHQYMPRVYICRGEICGCGHEAAEGDGVRVRGC